MWPKWLRRERRAHQPERLLSGILVPAGLVMAVGLGSLALAVMSSIHRSDDAALEQQRQLLSNALAERRRLAMLVAENTANSNLAVQKLWVQFDPNFAHAVIGLKLKDLFGQVHVFILDSSDRFVYALAGGSSVDARSLGIGIEELSPIVDDIRGRRHAGSATEIHYGRIAGSPGEQPVSAARLQPFMGRLTIVAAAPLRPQDATIAVPPGQPPVIVIARDVDNAFLDPFGKTLGLAHLRLADAGVAPPDRAFDLLDELDRPIAQFAWTPRLPGASLVAEILPLLGIAFACLLLLMGFVWRFMQRTTAAIAAREDRMRHLALHDPLSGLPNRTYFGERLAHLIEDVRRSDTLGAVFSIDLDRFKDINDTLGHAVGDAMIRAVALRIVRTMRADDMAARLGGDEFAVMAAHVPSLEVMRATGDRIVEALRPPYRIMGHTIVTGASVGIAPIVRASGEAGDILRCADLALGRAKKDGRNRACLYDAAMDADRRERKALEADLRHAIERDLLALEFQPVVSPGGERTVGIEALCRWIHPTHGPVPPTQFVSLAERSDLIVPLGEWVLRRACREAVAWPALTLAVNVSPLQFRRPDFVEMVERILEETGFDATRLELELTESTLVGNVEDAEAAMRKLKSLGVRFALDDFGTGYSSLLYLRTFPFDKLKIDQSFVANIEAGTDAAAIIHAIVSLGRGLKMKVTAEGVETAEQHLFLRAAGVHTLQGFRFGRPMSADAMAERLAGEQAQGHTKVALSALAG